MRATVRATLQQATLAASGAAQIALARATRAIWRRRERLWHRIDARRCLAEARRHGAAGVVDPAILARHVARWSVLGHSVDPTWYTFYAESSGVNDADYIPAEIYTLVVEPILNDHRMNDGLHNKCLFPASYGAAPFPATVAMNLGGLYHDPDGRLIGRAAAMQRLAAWDEVAVKPAMVSGGGLGFQIFRRAAGGALTNRAGEALTADTLVRTYGRDFVIQERIHQHAYYADLNPASLNCFRIQTYRSVRDDTVHVILAGLRMGGPGSETDNLHGGGLVCDIDPDGRLIPLARSEHGAPSEYPPTGHARFADLEPPPAYDRAVALAKSVAARVPTHRTLGFDIAIDRDGRPRIIEINFRSLGMRIKQSTTGIPLFREFTAEVIEHCRARLT